MARWTIRQSMIAISLLACGFAAFRSATTLSSRVIFWSTYVILAVAALGAVLRGRRSPRWVGFAIFGWAALISDMELIQTKSPMYRFIADLASQTFPQPRIPGRFLVVRTSKDSPRMDLSPDDDLTPRHFTALVEVYNEKVDAAVHIGHAWFYLTSAFLGASIARYFDPIAPTCEPSRPHPD